MSRPNFAAFHRRRLLEEMLLSMRAIPHLTRIEAQLMPFSGPVTRRYSTRDSAFTHGSSCCWIFRRCTRRSQHLGRHAPDALERPLFRAMRQVDLSGLCESRRWRDNDQYCSRGGALKFLKNIILLPGAGNSCRVHHSFFTSRER